MKYKIVGSRQCWMIQIFEKGFWKDALDDQGKIIQSFVTKWEAKLFLKTIK